MRDLEIRGAGNVLGVEQHGHVAAVGFEMYCKMLKEAVESLRGEGRPEVPQCRVEAPYDYIIPETYVADADERMMIYKRLARASEPDELESIERELADRFGAIPEQVRSLLDMTFVKLHGALVGVALARLREPGHRRRARVAALESAAEPPRTTGPAPAGVRRSAIGSNRLRRIAETIGTGGLGAPDSRGKATLDFAPGRSLSPEQCARLVETFGARLLFKPGKSFSVILEGDASAVLLQDVKNLLQVAFFSSKINDLPTRKGRPAGAPARRDASGETKPR
jgi:hypothetical protein